jgi:DNA-binding MarR family transcriptional regulator
MEMSQRVAGLDSAHVVFGSIFGVANRLQRVLDAVLPEVTAKQFWLLAVLSLFDEPPTLSQLAEAADTSHQNVRQLLDKLGAKGFVELTPDAKDSRAIRVGTTAKADRWAAAADCQAHDFMAAMFAEVDPAELDALARNLLTIHAAIGRLDRGTGEVG